MKVLLSFISLLFIFLTVNAQSIKYIDQDAHLSPKEKEQVKLKREQYRLKKIGASFHISKGLKRLNRELPMHCNSSQIQYALVNPDSSILIGVTLIARDSTDYKRDQAVVKRLSPQLKDYNPDNEWFATFRADVDLSGFKPVFYSTKKLKQYNADNGVEYKKNCKDLFLGSYQIERSIILNKKHRGIIEIHYFTRKNTNAAINKYVRNSNKMIHYN